MVELFPELIGTISEGAPCGGPEGRISPISRIEMLVMVLEA